MRDVHVVGAGPAGCFGAIAAAREGKNVLVSEEHKRVGDPVHCSGLVSQSGLEHMRHAVDYRKIAINEISRASIECASQKIVLVPKRAKALLIDRGEFDRMASLSAEREGVKIELGRKIRSASDFQAGCVIGCDGPSSSVASLFGFPKIGKMVSAYQADYECEVEDKHEAKLFVSPGHFPGFFGWLIPINEESAKIGFAIKPGGFPKRPFEALLKRFGAKGKENEFGAVIPISPRAKTAGEFGGRVVMLCGDAAGQVKATTGGGIFFGASCATIAGECAPDWRRYEAGWKREYGRDLAMHSLLRSVMDVQSEAVMDALLWGAKAFMLDKFVCEKAQMDRWGELASVGSLWAYADILIRGGSK